MKTKMVFFLCFLMFYKAMADEWKAYELWNHKADGTSSNSLVVIYKGEFFNPPKTITEMRERTDRSTPESLLKNLFWAVNNLNVDAYNKLFVPGEIANRFLADPKYKWKSLSLIRIVRYGDYNLPELRVTLLSGQRVIYIMFPVRKEPEGFFFTDRLINTDNRTYEFFRYFYTFSPVIGNPMEHELKEINFAKKGYIFITNTVPQGATNGPSLIFRFRGTDFGTNCFLEKWPTREDQSLSSPSNTLASAIAALNSDDVERYYGLLDPIERTNIIRYGTELAVGRTWGEWMRANFEQQAKQRRPSRIRLIKQIVYTDDTTALVYESADRQMKMKKDILYFRKSKTGWHISHKMEEVANMFPEYLGFVTCAYTKMFPELE